MDDEIADVGNPRERVGENKNGVVRVEQRVAQQQQRPDQTQPPERRRNDDALFLFCGEPLDDEARGEHEVAQPADHFPEVPLDPEKSPIAEACLPINHRETIHSPARLDRAPACREVQNTPHGKVAAQFNLPFVTVHH